MESPSPHGPASRRPTPHRAVLFGLCLLFSAADGLAQGAPGRRAPPPPEVIVAAVGSSRVFDRVEALGTLRANETVELRSTVTETVTAVYFEDNDRLQAGDELVAMTSGEEVAQLEEARSNIEEARAQFERIRPLAQQGVATQSDLDQRRRDLAGAEARLRGVQARLGDRLIVAPFDGVVGLRNISRGALVTPGDVITTINDDSIMKLDMSVASTYLPALRPGLRVEARSRALGSDVFEGRISAIDNAVDPVTRAIRVRAVLPNPEGRLIPGLLMTVTLFAGEREALLVPEESVLRRGRDAFVYVIRERDGQTVAAEQQIGTGTQFRGSVEVLEGLAAGDLVVTHGVIKLRPGAVVRVVARDEGDVPLSTMLRAREAS